LAEQRSRELTARRAAARARQIAGACTVLAVAALGAAVFAYFSSQRAHRAERVAQETRAAAEQARGNAEHLLGCSSDDFGRELESRDDAADLPTGQRAAALLRSLAEAPNASVAARRAYVDILVRIGFIQQTSANGYEDAVRTEREVMRIATDLGARSLSDLD